MKKEVKEEVKNEGDEEGKDLKEGDTKRGERVRPKKGGVRE